MTHGIGVYAAISACTADLLGGVAKDRRNSGQGFNFRGIDQFMNAVAPVIARNGLVVLPRVISKKQDERQTTKGGVMFYTHLHVEFDFVAVSDGSTHTVATEGEAMDSADKSTNKAMSAALKYALMQAFMIPTEDMQDADAHSPEDVTPRARPLDLSGVENPWTPTKDRVKALLLEATTLHEIAEVRASDDWEKLMKGAGVPSGWPDAMRTLATQRTNQIAA